MSNYAKHTVVRNDQIIGGLRRNGTHRVVLLDAGPFSQPHAALIPEASIIQAASYPAIEGPSLTLALGEIVHVEHYGPHQIVPVAHNADWPLLVPQYGPRYYVEFQGFDQWAIRDTESQGDIVQIPQTVRSSVFGGRTSPRSLEEAQAAAAVMSLQR